MGVFRRTERGKRTGAVPWTIDFRVAGRRYRAQLDGDLSREEALAHEARLRLGAEAEAKARERNGLTLGEILSRYWQEHGQHLASEGTEHAYLEIWAAELGRETRLASVTQERIATAIARWRKPITVRGRTAPQLLTPAAVNHRVRCLQRVLGRAAEVWGMAVPTIAWRRLRLHEAPPRDRSVGLDDRLAYLAALPPRSRWVHLMSLATGLRRGALLKLTMAELDWKRGVIRATSKGRAGGKPTPVPMTEAVLAVFQGMGRLPEVGAIFPVTIHELRKDRERARRATGLVDLRFHDMRHSFAQDLEDAGAGDLIPDALHHSGPGLRRRYAQARIDRLRAALDTAITTTFRDAR